MQGLFPSANGQFCPLQEQAMRRFFKMIKDQKGATAVEYGLILALIFLAVAGAVQVLASETTGMWNEVATAMNST